jgi:3-deoxy-manno-octulosonate cytidylyltransferase (CMP-KDO synthetase)
MKTIALIPARYAASRFPGKMMAVLAGKTVIWRTYESALQTGVFDEVMVVTDSEIIYNEIVSHGGKAIMSKREHESGSDRIAEAVENMLDVEIVVNVQGDTPFTQKEPLEKLLKVFEGEEGKKVQVASLMQELKDWKDIEDPNFVKVAVDRNFNSLFFSRSVIPYHYLLRTYRHLCFPPRGLAVIHKNTHDPAGSSRKGRMPSLPGNGHPPENGRNGLYGS